MVFTSFIFCNSYTGVFIIDYRNQLLNEIWFSDLRIRKVFFTDFFYLESLISSEVEISRWVNEGFFFNDFFIQNGILIIRCFRFFFCIDLQMQVRKRI